MSYEVHFVEVSQYWNMKEHVSVIKSYFWDNKCMNNPLIGLDDRINNVGQKSTIRDLYTYQQWTVK